MLPWRLKYKLHRLKYAAATKHSLKHDQRRNKFEISLVESILAPQKMLMPSELTECVSPRLPGAPGQRSFTTWVEHLELIPRRGCCALTFFCVNFYNACNQNQAEVPPTPHSRHLLMSVPSLLK